MSVRNSSNCSPVELQNTDKAAETIQRNFRGFKDRLKAREKAAFNINQLIEYAEEQDHLNLNKFFNRWIKLIKNKPHDEVNNYISSSIQDDQSQISEGKIIIEPTYTGIHLNEEFNEEDFVKMLQSFKNQEILHTKYVLMILNKAINVMKSLGNINDIECASPLNSTETTDFRVNVIGSFHFIFKTF